METFRSLPSAKTFTRYLTGNQNPHLEFTFRLSHPGFEPIILNLVPVAWPTWINHLAGPTGERPVAFNRIDEEQKSQTRHATLIKVIYVMKRGILRASDEYAVWTVTHVRGYLCPNLVMRNLTGYMYAHIFANLCSP